jgi:hypothetical protein
MSHDGRPERAEFGARAAATDRRTGLIAITGLSLTLVLAACGSSSSSGGVAGATGTPTTSAETGASASAEASSSAAASGALNQAFLTFQEVNASKVFGGGTITDLGDGSSAVTLGVVAVGYTDPLPARLVSGACTDAATAPLPSFAPPPSEAAGSAAPSKAASAAPSVAPSVEASGATGSVAPTPATLPVDLTPVAGGGSNTVVQVAEADLLSSPSSVLIYKSAADPTLVACADVSATLVLPSAAAGGSSAPAASASEMPLASGSTTP